jgi:hypothetical protein
MTLLRHVTIGRSSSFAHMFISEHLYKGDDRAESLVVYRLSAAQRVLKSSHCRGLELGRTLCDTSERNYPHIDNGGERYSCSHG